MCKMDGLVKLVRGGELLMMHGNDTPKKGPSESEVSSAVANMQLPVEEHETPPRRRSQLYPQAGTPAAAAAAW